MLLSKHDDEQNDSKIIMFGWVDLILWSYLESQSFPNCVSFARAKRWGNLFPVAVHTFILCFVYMDQWPTMGFPQTNMYSLNALEWKSTLFRVILRIISFAVETTPKL